MKHAHLIKLTVFSHETLDRNKILESLNNFFPFNLKQSKIEIKITNVEGFNGKNIEIFEITLTKNSLIKLFIKSLLDRLDNQQKELILEQAESRLDDNLDFFLRFDKNFWMNGQKLVLTDSGNCFHLRINIAAFPKKREAALKIVKEMFLK